MVVLERVQWILTSYVARIGGSSYGERLDQICLFSLEQRSRGELSPDGGRCIHGIDSQNPFVHGRNIKNKKA